MSGQQQQFSDDVFNHLAKNIFRVDCTLRSIGSLRPRPGTYSWSCGTCSGSQELGLTCIEIQTFPTTRENANPQEKHYEISPTNGWETVYDPSGESVPEWTSHRTRRGARRRRRRRAGRSSCASGGPGRQTGSSSPRPQSSGARRLPTPRGN